MSGKNRSQQIDRSRSGTYHISCRTVRRAFLMGEDEYTGKDFSHRRNWVEKRVKQLAAFFAIDIIFVTFLSNHFHLIIRNLPERVESWSDKELLRRAIAIFPYKFSRLGVKDKDPTEENIKELSRDKKLVAEMRLRLSDPSWFMRQLNQNIARRANDEDECTGHFFDGKFRCMPISNTFALLICGLYLDLNEYVAGMADSAESSQGSSIGFRLRGKALREAEDPGAFEVDGFLCPVFSKDEPQGYPAAGGLGSHRASDKGMLPMTLEQYRECYEALKRSIDESRKKGVNKPPISKKEIEDLLRKQGNFSEISSDFGL